jgi:hypothetical protein
VLAGCATVPSLPYEKGVGVADILRNVKCELAAAYAENAGRHPWLKDWAAGIELTLDVTEARSGGVTAQILVPIQVTDSFHMGANARRAAKAQSVSSVTFSTTLAGLNQAECAGFKPERGPEPLLRGHLGLKTWITRAAEAIEAGRHRPADRRHGAISSNSASRRERGLIPATISSGSGSTSWAAAPVSPPAVRMSTLSISPWRRSAPCRRRRSM